MAQPLSCGVTGPAGEHPGRLLIVADQSSEGTRLKYEEPARPGRLPLVAARATRDCIMPYGPDAQTGSGSVTGAGSSTKVLPGHTDSAQQCKHDRRVLRATMTMLVFVMILVWISM